VKYQCGVPVIVNAPEQTEYAAGGSIFLGNRESVTLRHPDYNSTDDIIPFGCSWFADLVNIRSAAT